MPPITTFPSNSFSQIGFWSSRPCASSPVFLRIPCSNWFSVVSALPLLTAFPSVLLLKLVPGRFGLAPLRSFSLEFLANWFPAVPALPSSPRFLRIPCSKWFPGVSGLPRPATFPSSSLLKSVSCCPGLAPRHFPFEFLVQPGSRASRPRQSSLPSLRNPWPSGGGAGPGSRRTGSAIYRSRGKRRFKETVLQKQTRKQNRRFPKLRGPRGCARGCRNPFVP